MQRELVKILWIMIGGSLGAVSRYGTSLVAVRLFGGEFAWGTLIVNLSGCFLIGAAFSLAERVSWMGTLPRLFFVTGYLGALTTFSTFGLETASFVRAASYRLTAANFLANNLLGLGLVFLGMRVGRLFDRHRPKEEGETVRKKLLPMAFGVLAVLSVVMFIVAHHADREIERVVSEQFNSQQLLVARKVAHDIRQHFRFLETGLNTFSRVWAQDVETGEDPWKHATQTFDLLKNWDVLAIGHVAKDAGGPVTIVEGHRSVGGVGFDLGPYEAWARKPENRGKVLIGKTLRPDSGPFKNLWIVIMVTPLYCSPRDGGSHADACFLGQTFLIVDAVSIATRYCRNVRSGKTGYAWIVDHKGTFMAHYEQEFVGNSSFDVRREKNPNITFVRINDLVTEHLLRGEEGTDWYVSGWHLGSIGEMKKLLAYSPIFLDEEQGARNLWSVGVAAPMDEVSGLLRSILLRQWMVVGLCVGVIVLVLALLLTFSWSWSKTLQAEVIKKTEHLQRTEADLRVEHEHLKASIARLMETQERLLRAERLAAIGEAAAHLSHEIRNPLMLIGGFALQVLRALPASDPNVKKLQIIEDEIKRLERMLNDVRDFTRSPKPQKEWHSLSECIVETLELMESALAAQKIDCETLLLERPLSLWYDPRQMKQVLVNVLKNAMEAMPEGGKITISTDCDREKAWISIADTGSGMSEEVCEKLFTPFFTTKKKGTGLGLAVCNKIVEDHHGEIAVRSRMGEGSQFTIFLPLHSDDATDDVVEAARLG